jgi:hypothetical protein
MNAPAEEVARIWMRNPLAGKQDGNMYIFSWHNKKLQTRFAEGGFKTIDELKRYILNNVHRIVERMTYWKYGPEVRTALFTLIRKDSGAAGQQIATAVAAKSAVVAANATIRLVSAEDTAEKAKAETLAATAALQSAAAAIAAVPTLPETVLGVDKIGNKTSFIFNMVAEATVDKFTQRLLALVPADEAAMQKMMDTILRSHIVSDSSYHTVYMRMIMAMDAKHSSRPYPTKPSAALLSAVRSHLEHEPRSVAMAAMADADASMVEQAAAQARAMMLFVGLMYRFGMISLEELKNFIQLLIARLSETTRGTSEHDFFVQSMILVVVRAGKMLMAESDESRALIDDICKIVKDNATSPRTRALHDLLMQAIRKEFHIAGIHAWRVGAPAQNLMPTPRRLSKTRNAKTRNGKKTAKKARQATRRAL